MRLTAEGEASKGSVNLSALNWSSLGRLVRQGTLEAVAMHFAALAEEQQDDAGETLSIREVSPETGVFDEGVEE